MEFLQIVNGRLVLRALCVLAVLLVTGDVAHGRPSGWSSDSFQHRQLVRSQATLLRKLNINGLTRRRRNLDHLARIVKRSSDHVKMDSVKNIYKMYYTQLTPFITALEAKLPASPSDLQYVDVVTKIVKPGSDDFNDRQYVVKQILLAFDVTTLIILEVGKFLPADDQAWLTQSSGLINMYIGLCKMSIASLPDGQAEIDSVSGGIGGINKGVYARTNVEYLNQILKLASALKTSG